MEVKAVTPSFLINAYANGYFPMAESRDDAEIFWVDPEERGTLPFPDFHIPRSLRKVVKQDCFTVRLDSAFRGVMKACAAPAPDRDNTWISQGVEDLYCQLFDFGYAHSVECWTEGRLVGGLYGVALGGAFFGESMFQRQSNASKVALVHLVAHLIQGGYSLLDVQFKTEHLEQFGVKDISRDDYQSLLSRAIKKSAMLIEAEPLSGQDALAIIDQFQLGAHRK